MANATPDLRLPSQPQGITAHWLVPNYTAWWQRHMCVNNLPRVALNSGEVEPATCWSQVQRPNHSATESFRGQLSPFHCLRSQTPQFRLELLWSHESEVNCGCYLYNLIYILAYIKGKGNNVELRELSGLESVSFMIKNGTLRCLRLVECKGDTACIKRCPIKTRYVGATEDIKCSDLSREDSQILNKCWRKVTVEKFM